MKSWFAPGVAFATVAVSTIAATAPALAVSLSYTDAYAPDASTTVTLDAIDALTGGLTDAEVRSGSYGFTDIEDSVLSVQKFDASLGTLKSVKLTFDAGLWQKAYYEHTGNVGPAGRNLSFNFAANLGLKSAAGGASIFDIPLSGANDFTVPKYDGSLDFGGPSGGKFATGLNGQYQATTTITDATALQAFIGAGSIDYLFSAFGSFGISGPGNLTSGVSTLAKGAIRVDYEYDKSVPEPVSLLGLVAVAGGAIVQRRRSRAVVD